MMSFNVQALPKEPVFMRVDDKIPLNDWAQRVYRGIIKTSPIFNVLTVTVLMCSRTANSPTNQWRRKTYLVSPCNSAMRSAVQGSL
jgi:hypothetical protein